MSEASADDGISKRTWLALAAMALGVFIIANDFTALSVAIPRIEAQLHTTLSRAQWVINGYALVFGVLIVTGGRLADLFGRKRAFLAGAVAFGVFSLAAGVAPNVNVLILCRALMGLGGAVMWPAILGLTYTILPLSRKGLAGGLILGVAGLGNAAGPLLGGWLTDAVSWRLVAGGAIGLGLNTAIVLSAASLTGGIRVAFRVDAALAVIGLGVALWRVHGPRRSAEHAASQSAHYRVRA